MGRETALSLMQQALAIYDQQGDGATAAACHLQAAIDVETGAKHQQSGEEIDADLLDWFDAVLGPYTRNSRGTTH